MGGLQLFFFWELENKEGQGKSQHGPPLFPGKLLTTCESPRNAFQPRLLCVSSFKELTLLKIIHALGGCHGCPSSRALTGDPQRLSEICFGGIVGHDASWKHRALKPVLPVGACSFTSQDAPHKRAIRDSRFATRGYGLDLENSFVFRVTLTSNGFANDSPLLPPLPPTTIAFVGGHLQDQVPLQWSPCKLPCWLEEGYTPGLSMTPFSKGS